MTVKDRPLPVVALVGDQLRHRWFASRLAAAPTIELRGVISEAQPPRPRGANADEDVLVADHFERRRRAEQRYFGSAERWPALARPTLAVERGATGTDRVVAWVGARDPEYVLLFGCGVVRAPLLDTFAGRTVNIHLGLSPYYRGHATNFWPLVNGEPECIGATVHVVTSEVDAGPILRQVRPEIGSDDGSHDIGCKALAAGVETLLAVLPAYARGALESVPQQPGGRPYRHADFDAAPAAAIRKLRDRFEAGMIPEYLEHKRERDSRFPIVE